MLSADPNVRNRSVTQSLIVNATRTEPEEGRHEHLDGQPSALPQVHEYESDHRCRQERRFIDTGR
jgi:hypothetical protein